MSEHCCMQVMEGQGQHNHTPVKSILLADHYSEGDLYQCQNIIACRWLRGKASTPPLPPMESTLLADDNAKHYTEALCWLIIMINTIVKETCISVRTLLCSGVSLMERQGQHKHTLLKSTLLADNND